MGQVKTTIRIEDKASAQLKKIYDNINKVNGVMEKMSKSGSGVRKVSNEIRGIGLAASSSARQTSLLTSKLRRLASTYMGVMGMGAAFSTADTITGASNRLTTLGTQQYRMNDAQAQSFSTETMDKIYAAAQRAATSYTGMMSNVAKSVTLAGDAFGKTSDQQINNAIAFQEIMAKSYALAGASAAEQSSSMYQMVQALGSGVLQGDELRSVREGAPLAYKAIEEFAQGVLHSEESLKELASQGLITSDIVTAAILGMGDKTSAAFEKIDKTWLQLWIRFKNDTVRAFQPFFEALRELANSDSFNFLYSKAVTALQDIGTVLLWIVQRIQDVTDFIANNWNVIQPILNGVIFLVGVAIVSAIGKMIQKLIISIAMWTAQNTTMLITLGFLALLVIWFSIVGVTAQSVGELLIMLGLALMAVSLALASPILFFVGLITVAIGVFLAFTQQVVGGIYVVGAFFQNLGLTVANIFLGIWGVIQAVASNFKLAFQKAIAGVTKIFAQFMQFAIGVITEIANALNALPFVSIDVSGLNASASKWAAKEAETQGVLNQDWTNVGEAWRNGVNTYDTWGDGWVNGAYNAGANVGAGIQDSITGFFDSIGDGLSGIFGDAGANGLDNINSLIDMLDGIGSSAGDTASNTGSMAKSMELTQNDLKYLREIAEMEAINKYTTAEIHVDMTNNNTMNNMGDLDGIVTHLSDVLREEMDILANGTHTA
jgi:tape measure domain-containing protein